MSQLIKMINELLDKQPEQTALVCNYQDNYYGDQLCTRDISRIPHADA
ncbi:hypothetical protein SG34_026735 [Thalassomonas viridans]|uniref:Uncharacterized protein n=1 Tax=Thalassomonas viridans TaxID=137584 RepID=A0AAE9Z2J1_9GAMM|nr:hypothetical protein [Thalassomonas viridans]WDE04865.1 hypothetical protein SG34_026735 [Thalassomonas viridans]